MTDFEALYQRDTDPWSVRHSWYERRKRAVLMASLPENNFGKTLELGCGIGETTCLLAPICTQVIAVDISETAAALCQQRVVQTGSEQVSVHVLHLPTSWPPDTDGVIDLIVVSELAYYFSNTELSRFIDGCMRSLAYGGYWVMCHYKPDFHDRLGSTAVIHQRVNAIHGLTQVVRHDDEQFRLDIWRNAAGAVS